MANSKCNESYIREAAYYLWQNAGSPWGQEEKFWSMAVEQMSSCKSAKSPAKKTTRTTTAKKATTSKSSKK